MLGFSREEWDRLPWHDQQLYLEGMEEELDAQVAQYEQLTAGTSEASAPVGSFPEEGSALTDNVGPDPDLALAGMGFSVQQTTFAGA